MPTINRQTTRKTTPAPTRTSRSEPVGEGVKLLGYGRGKTGKTRLACTFPKPLLLIGTEDGTKSVSTGRREHLRTAEGNVVYDLLDGKRETGVRFVRLQRTTEIPGLVEVLVRDGYRSAALDHAGGLQDMILKEVLGLDEVPVQKSWGLTDRQTWGTVGAQFKERCRSLLDLADRVGLDVMVVAHERNFNDEGTGDLVVPTVGAALTPSAAGWLNGACDYICQTFIRAEERAVTNKVAGKDVETRTRTGKMEFCLRTGQHETFMTGFRLPPGRHLPDVVVDPDYDKILAIIKGEADE